MTKFSKKLSTWPDYAKNLPARQGRIGTAQVSPCLLSVQNTLTCLPDWNFTIVWLT